MPVDDLVAAEASVKETAAEASVEESVEESAEKSVEVLPVVPEIPANPKYPTLVATSVTDLVFYAPDLPPIVERSAPRDRFNERFPERFDNESPRGNPRYDRNVDRNLDRNGDRNLDRNLDRGIDRGNDPDDDFGNDSGSTVRRRARRRPGEEHVGNNDPANTVVRIRTPREPELITEPQRIKGSTRLEAKKQRRRDGRDAGRRRTVVTESEFLARREAVDRTMIVRDKDERIQIGVLEDGVLVEHYVARSSEASLIGNVYLGKVQNVLPSMEAAFVDIGRGRNAVLYSGEVDWDAAETGNQPRRIELALKPGDKVLVQVTKDPVGHKGARLTSQVSLPGRYLVYVPNGSMNGISRKLPDTERARLKRILKEVLPENVGVIVRTAAEGATEEQLTIDVQRLTTQWAEISRKAEIEPCPSLLHSESDLLIKIVRDVFNEDFHRMVISGSEAKATIENYLNQVAPELLDRVEAHTGNRDAFEQYRITEQIEKALDRKVYLPSGGSLVIDRTEAMTVVDVNTGKFVGSGGNLEETVTKNNIESAEEIVRQLRLRDIGGIIVIDFIDMVLESNRDLVHRRLIECLSRDRTKHQVAEVTSLGLVQMTRKKLGLGLLETFSEPCEVCAGRGVIVHHEPVTRHRGNDGSAPEPRRRSGKSRGNTVTSNGNSASASTASTMAHAIPQGANSALAQIAASTIGNGHHNGDTAHTAASDIVAVPSGEVSSMEDRHSTARSTGARTTSRRSSSSAQSTTATADAFATPHNDVDLEVIEILDIPVKASRQRKARVSPQSAEILLDNVLGALPEPKQPGQGRGRSRRVSTSQITAGELASPTLSSNEGAQE
ncbi:Rne/Rng family ribonuclease [Alpinimonas psychrophila]